MLNESVDCLIFSRPHINKEECLQRHRETHGMIPVLADTCTNCSRVTLCNCLICEHYARLVLYLAVRRVADTKGTM